MQIANVGGWDTSYITWTYDTSYLRHNGYGYFTVIAQPSYEERLYIRAEYSIGSVYMFDTTEVVISSNTSNWNFIITANSGPYGVGDVIDVYLQVTQGNMDYSYFNYAQNWSYDTSCLRFDGFYSQYARFTVIKADTYQQTKRITATYSVGSVNTSDYVDVYIRSSGVSVTSAQLSTRSLSMDANTSDRISVNVYPAQAANYRVEWISSNTNIVTVSGNGATATLTARDYDGTATVTAYVTDIGTGQRYSDSCTVRVEKEKRATYNPSATASMGTNSFGASLYDELRTQFNRSFGSYPNDNTAKISFSRGSGTEIGALRLNGVNVGIGTEYTMAQLRNMILEVSSSGTMSLPYSLTYNYMTLSGTISVNVLAATVTVSASLNNNNAYTFSENTNSGAVATLINTAIQNALRTSTVGWSYLRFTTPSTSAGVLFQNSSKSQLSSTTNVSTGSLSSIYFVPAASGGTFSTTFSVYSMNGGLLAMGTLNLSAPAAPKIDPSKLPPVTATPANMVGKVAGDYLFTDIVTYVNGKPIESININGRTLINVEALRYHGFTVVWDGSARTLRAAKSSSAPTTGSGAPTSSSGTVGAKLGSYYYTDIVTYLEGYAINGFNTDGKTYICAEDMEAYGFSVVWNPTARTLTVTSK
ncbi:MAG: Ig-like domain-containing protein [Oscillospiraceae bacterium]|nr:Ig-like domain-containing protein [Oscillospiraceae bacterium]